MKQVISVIVPVYNVEKYINKCVESLTKQTYGELEIILVDDGSQDRCPIILDEWEKKDKRIKVIHQINGGLSDARNAGLKVASGDYIAFVDSDDYIDETMYEKLLSMFQNNEIDIAICNFQYVDENGNSENYREKNDKLPIHDSILTGKEVLEKKVFEDKYWYWVVVWNKLYRRKIFEDYRFIEGKIHEDEYAFHHTMSKCNKIACCSEQLYYYVQRNNSIMGKVMYSKDVDYAGALFERTIFYIGENLNGDYVYKNVFQKGLSTLYEHYNAKDKKSIRYISEAKRTARSLIKEVSASNRMKLLPYTLFPRLRFKTISATIKMKNVLSYVQYIKQLYKTNILLIDTPVHENLGDQAITLAEKQVVQKVNPSAKIVELTANQINYREKRYAAVTPMNRYILVHGGGFLGALWPDEEERFRRIVQAFKKQKIIVFPQTVTFDMTTPEGRKYLEESQQIYASHPDLTIFVREKRSHAFMQQYFPTVRCLLVPDVVTLLDVPDMAQPRKGILFCMRCDLEKALDDAAQQKMLAAVKTQYPRENIEFTDTVIDHDIMLENREEEVNKKLMQFSGARLIVTDRLHGMIFAALTNTPCIAMSNSNGKVKAVYEWIKDNDYIRFANSVIEFKQQLQTLAINQQYIYARKLVENEFKPLYEEIRKLR